MNIEKLRQHPFVVFGQEHYNPLGIVRTLGENGIHPTAFVYGGGLRLTSKSKYLRRSMSSSRSMKPTISYLSL